MKLFGTAVGLRRLPAAKIYRTLMLCHVLPLIFGLACLDSGRGKSRCATDLTYVTNRFTAGEEAIRNAGKYVANLTVGSEDFTVPTIVDTASANLVINANNFNSGFETSLGNRSILYDNGQQKGPALEAKDSVDVACTEDFPTRFALTAKEISGQNYLGLAYNDPNRLPHEAQTPSFFTQLVAREGLEDVFSLCLCKSRGNSWLLLGGIDEAMEGLVGNFIPIIEKTAYVVPALNMRRADNKNLIAHFPLYDVEQKAGVRTIIDSAASFMLLPPEMAKSMADEVEKQASSLNLHNQFPPGFFRTERSNSTKVIRFNSLTQIRQFPSFEINFHGKDEKIKALELSPLHYFKEIDTENPLIRVFAVRETAGDTVLGQPFLENHYTYFDRKNGRIGFANIDVACSLR